ncbi:MAG: tRNA 4-thiouridine(8) synthase ThiI [bacterium]|nr:tRNA 4-thiouridine(8) synthase ThiI [bacterium]
MKTIKALVLFSGGLDSMLAVKILQKQNIEVGGACFKSNFFGCEKAREPAEFLGIKLFEIDISEEILELVKNPPSGYGKHLNPCVDCHALMVKKASEFLQKGSTAPRSAMRGDYGAGIYDFIATGEVLGQRPFSQNKDALKRVEKLAGVEILRPLSAKLLPETEIEKQGLVVRGKLLDIQGRTRERQMELAEKYNLKYYSAPAGGCLLTDPEFSQRLLVMLDNWPECDANDVELLKYGRVFWFKTRMDTNKKRIPPGGTNHEWVLAVVGRNKEDNENLEKLAKKGDVMLELEEIMGPLTLVRNYKLQITNDFEIEIPEKLKMSELKMGEEKSEEEILQIAALLTGYYATKARGQKVKIKIINK